MHREKGYSLCPVPPCKQWWLESKEAQASSTHTSSHSCPELQHPHSTATHICLHAVNPPFCGSHLWNSGSSMQFLPVPVDAYVMLDCAVGSTDNLCSFSSSLPAVNWLLHSPLRFWSAISLPANSSLVRGLPRVQEHFFFHSSLPRVPVPPQVLSHFFFLLSYSYLVLFLPFQQSEIFCQSSVDVLWEFFHI